MKQIPENRMHLGGCFKPGEAHGSSLQRSATSGSMTTLTLMVPGGAGWSPVRRGEPTQLSSSQLNYIRGPQAGQRRHREPGGRGRMRLRASAYCPSHSHPRAAALPETLSRPARARMLSAQHSRALFRSLFDSRT